jgi:hypothetical protein
MHQARCQINWDGRRNPSTREPKVQTIQWKRVINAERKFDK